jgi:hypothetical protein
VGKKLERIPSEIRLLQWHVIKPITRWNEIQYLVEAEVRQLHTYSRRLTELWTGLPRGEE